MAESTSISKFRSAASQLCAAFPYYGLTLSYGLSVGYQTILIAELYKDNSEIVTTVDQLSWFASLELLTILGLIIGGTMTQHFGTRITALLSSLLFGSSWLLYYYSTSISSLMLARALSLMTASVSVTHPYVSEISEPYLRGTFLVVSQIAIVSGTFVCLLLGTFMHWRRIAMLNLSVPIITALTVLLVPNSPIWLANRRRLVEAEKALCSVRGWVKPDRVQSELQALLEKARESMPSADDKRIGWRERWARMLEHFLRRSFYAPLATMCLMFLVYNLGGGPLVESYATVMFRQMNSPIEESLATAILAATGVIGKVIVICFIRNFGKRKLALFFSAVVFLCQSLIATIGMLNLTGGYYAWIPSIALVVANLAWKSGIAAISFMLVSEIFPSPVRYFGTAASFSFYAVVTSATKKWYLYVVEAVTLPVVFGLFAMVNAVEFVTYFLVMPETEGRSLQEIENYFKRDQIKGFPNKSSV